MPFNEEQFLNVFAVYNEAVFPIQLLLNLVACAAVYLALRSRADSTRTIAALLAILWFWSGLVYHVVFFGRINTLAYLFGTLFVLQGVLILYCGWWRRRPRIRFSTDVHSIVGLAVVAYSMFVYPLIGYMAGHSYPTTPTFGVPCPITIFTFGIWLMARERPSFYVLVIPTLWSLLGVSASLLLGITEDLGLIAAAAISLGLFTLKDLRASSYRRQTSGQ
jgi:hypothetical protein